MTVAANDVPGPVPANRRRPYLYAALVGVLALAVAVGGYAWYRTPAAQPPTLALAGIDPAVAEAITSARAAVVEAPQSASAWGHLGMVLAAHEFTAEALTCFERAESLDRSQPCWPYYQGVALITQRDLDAAIPKLFRTVSLCDNVPDAPRLRLGDLLMEQGRIDEAEEQFRRVLEKHPNHPRAHLGLARLDFRRGDLEGALHHLSFSRTDAHTQKAAYVLAAQVQQSRGASTEEDLRRANDLPKDPSWPDPFVDEVGQLRTGKQANLERADKRLRSGQVAEALELLRQTVHDYPDSDWGWYLLGKGLIQQRQWAAAERALRQAVRLTPTSAEIQFLLGVAFFQQNDRARAVACFRKATELKPDYALAYFDLGQCLAVEADPAGALEAFRSALRCQPNLAEAHAALGSLLARTGHDADATGHLRRAVELNPHDAASQRLLDEVLRRSKPAPTNAAP
jgi:tetratricopeptide (TPR) repeat protein